MVLLFRNGMKHSPYVGTTTCHIRNAGKNPIYMQFPHSSYLIATKISYHFVAINKCVKARYYYTVFGIYDNDVYITAQRE